MRVGLRVVLVGLGAIGLVAACGRKPVFQVPDASAAIPTKGEARAPETIAVDSGSRPGAAEVDRRLAILEERIHFDFDRWTLTPEAQAVLNAKAEILASSPEITVRIEGHADERGSDEYNLVLSSKRAIEAKQYLMRLGIDSSRFETMGYGEEKPLVHRSDEVAWSVNRRAEFRISAGGSRP